MRPRELLDAVLALPPEERLELASRLLASVEEAPTEEWSQAWLAECDARVTAAESGAEPPLAWDEAYERLRAALALLPEEREAEARLALLHAALDEGDQSGIAPDGVLDRVRERLKARAER